MIQLNLSAEKQAALEQVAAAAGMDVTAFICEVVEDRLKERHASRFANAPFEVWNREFTAFLDSQKSRNPHVDDSRESIYD